MDVPDRCWYRGLAHTTVKDHDVGAGSYQLTDHLRTDETGSSDDQDAHVRLSATGGA